jgi:outer membrane protein assembly factor BamE (lipoprotein component of BamABCDE complex)
MESKVKKMKKILILILLFGLSGCAFVSQNFNDYQYQGLKNGMSREEVRSALGAPHKQSTLIIEGKQYEAWEYPTHEPQRIQYNRLGYPYYKVFFLDGKVARWDKDKVYAQPEFEFRESPAPEPTVTNVIIYKEEVVRSQALTTEPEKLKTKVSEPLENLK